MVGAILGDVIGSIYEFNGIKTKGFPLFSDRCRATDDSYMAMAVAKALCDCRSLLRLAGLGIGKDKKFLSKRIFFLH